MREAAIAALALALIGAPQIAATAPRQIAPDIVAPPQVGPEELERDVPRGPLGELGLAGIPKPKTKGRDGDTLFKPLATAAGVVEAAGLTVTLAGIEPVQAEETCRIEEKEWACGIRARTAFRGLLRGRAIVCVLPPDLLSGPVSTSCLVGTQDVGAWLVSNGWARAGVGSPYAEAGEKARSAAKGIFGAAPDAAGLPPEPPAFSASADDQPILDLALPTDGGDAQPDAPAPAPQGLY